jgi:hypothetical protein
MEINNFIENYIKENHPETSDKVQNELGNAIRAGYYFGKGNETPVDEDSIEFLNHIYNKAKRIQEAKDLQDNVKYDRIFSEKISRKVSHLFDWCDPDTTYEEDVAAFMNAFREYVEEQNKLNKYN